MSQVLLADKRIADVMVATKELTAIQQHLGASLADLE
jgi:hypothetical protein